MTDIIDAWMQFPNKPYLLDPMFDSLRRWPTNWKSLAGDNPAITHAEALDRFRTQGVTKVIASTWWGPAGPMITNDEVAAAVRAHPEAGFSLMLACDFTVADENTRFSLAYSRIGGSLDGGSSWMLPRVVGRRKALEIALLAEPFNAATALQLGLINEVAPSAEFDAVIGKWCDRLASGPTLSYGRIKTILAAASQNDFVTQLDAERAAFASCAGTSDFREGVTAFLEKRTPRFLGR